MMKPEDFDISFDFDKAYGVDPNANKSSFDDDFDLDAALERELGPDFDRLFEEEYAASQAELNARLEAQKQVLSEPRTEDEDEEEDEELEEDEEYDPSDDFGAFDVDMDEPEEDDSTDEDFSAVFAAVSAAHEAAEETPAEEAEEAPRPIRRKPVDLGAAAGKVNFSAIGEKFAAAAAGLGETGRRFLAALKEIKPGKMDKKAKRRFKDDVLPVLIGGAALVVCMTFIIGSVGRNWNSVDRQQAALEESIAQAEAEAAAAAEIRNILNTAADQAEGYNYLAAIDTLDSYKTDTRDLTDEMVAARAEYAEAADNLVVWDDPTAIPNLSFHVLIEDPTRAYADDLASSYKSNFVTTAQFAQILDQLYTNGYVVVNLDSCLSETTAADGTVTCTVQPIYLPAGKKPIMITETLVNYFGYMVDSDDDGAPDKGGAGFANQLVIHNGDIKANYVDADGNQFIGDYDLVPILNTFMEDHPGFSYRGAKAILAVTGEEGVFGWRTAGGDEAAISGAKALVSALRADGYQIASNSYGNLNYGSTSLDQIDTDLNSWNTKAANVLGEVDILVIARGGELAPGSTRFEKAYTAGFRYVLDNGTAGSKLGDNFFYQNRIMVVGSNLNTAAYAAFFTLPTT